MENEPHQIYFQAHRGTMDEAPENTLSAFRHAWQFPGAIPETDVRTTADGHLICLHDATLARTTNADPTMKHIDVAELTLAEVHQWDAGVLFDERFAGEKVPTLDQILSMLVEQRERRLYLEPKAVDLADLENIVARYGCANRLLFVHKSPAFLAELQVRFPGVPTMSWLSGTPSNIQRKFEEVAATNFAGISQLQLHLHARQTKPEIIYTFSAEYLTDVHKRLQSADVDLQLCPFEYDAKSLRPLVDLGVRWFVSGAPERFIHCLNPQF